MTLSHAHQTGALPYTNFAHDAPAVYAEALRGRRHSDVAALANLFVAEDRRALFPSTEPLLRMLHGFGLAITVVSGAPQEVLEAYQPPLEIDAVYGLQLEVAPNGTFTGVVARNYGAAETKAGLVTAIRASGARILVALGNALSDTPLLGAAVHAFYIEDEAQSGAPDKALLVPVQSVVESVRAVLTNQRRS